MKRVTLRGSLGKFLCRREQHIIFKEMEHTAHRDSIGRPRQRVRNPMNTGNSGYVRCPMIFRQNAGVNYPGGCQLLFRNISTRKLERTKMKHLNIEKSKHWLTERRYPVSVEAGLSLKGLQCFHHIGVNKEIEFSLEFTACLDTVK